ncbi:MAG: hypothetical protein ACE5HS_09210 [bacterium]
MLEVIIGNVFIWGLILIAVVFLAFPILLEFRRTQPSLTLNRAVKLVLFFGWFGMVLILFWNFR